MVRQLFILQHIMRKSFYIFLCLFTICLYTNAQSKSIIDDLNTPKAGQGNIVIYQDEDLKNLIGSNMISSVPSSGTSTVSNQLSTSSDESDAPKNFVRAKGYRIQVYSGNDQKVAKNEANSRKGAIQSSFPNMEVTVSYNSPVWRVRAGNFRTQDQAEEALSELKARFPGFGREMRIVDDVVKIPVE